MRSTPIERSWFVSAGNSIFANLRNRKWNRLELDPRMEYDDGKLTKQIHLETPRRHQTRSSQNASRRGTGASEPIQSSASKVEHRFRFAVDRHRRPRRSLSITRDSFVKRGITELEIDHTWPPQVFLLLVVLLVISSAKSSLKWKFPTSKTRFFQLP